MPQPIPLHGIKDGITRAGTGFLVDDGRRMWLVTCAHLITGLEATPPEASRFRSGRLNVVGRPFGVDLYVQNAQRYAAVVNQRDGLLADVIAVRLTPIEMAALIAYGSYDIGSIVAPEIGELVQATGFPGMGVTPIAPTLLKARIDDIAGLSIQLSVPGARGFSGSALEGEAGLLGILHGDLGADPNFTNGLAISFDLVGPQLFI